MNRGREAPRGTGWGSSPTVRVGKGAVSPLLWLLLLSSESPGFNLAFIQEQETTW